MDNELRTIKQFLGQKIRIPPDQLPDTAELFASGVFSSLTVLELIALIESTYSIRFEPDDLTQENFRDIESLARAVNLRRAEKGAGQSLTPSL